MVLPRKLEIERKLSATFVIKAPRYHYCFCALNVVYLYGLQMGAGMLFSVSSIISEFGSKGKLNFNGFLGFMIFEIFQVFIKHTRLERTPPTFPYLEHFLAIDPSFGTINKQLHNKIGETFCEPSRHLTAQS